MVYGGASTGKTSVVLQVFRHLNRPFIYSSCRTCYNPRILFESILNYLLLHSKCSSNEYSSAKRYDKPSEVVALSNVMESLSSTSVGKIVYLIVDHVDLIKEWDKGTMILQYVFSYKIASTWYIIFISGLSPDVYYSNMGYTDPKHEYSEEDLRQIFLRNQANRKLYSAFLEDTRRVDELSTTFSSLFRKYCESLNDIGISPNEELKRRLYSHPCLNEMFRVSGHPNDDDTKGEREGRRKPVYTFSELEILDFHMSTSAKYLLIATFLASRNPAKLDASMFDSTGGMDNRKRKHLIKKYSKRP